MAARAARGGAAAARKHHARAEQLFAELDRGECLKRAAFNTGMAIRTARRWHRKWRGPVTSMKAARIARGLRAQDVAAELQIFPSVYSRWENSDSLPRRVSYAMLYAMDRLSERQGDG